LLNSDGAFFNKVASSEVKGSKVKNSKHKISFYKLKGKIQAFNASPTELGQSISTVGNSARSLELALAAAADFKQKGLSLNGSFALMWDSVGLIESLERIPRVAGFMDHAKSYDLATDEPSASGTYAADTNPVFG
jgi:hypothetical protein